MSTDNNDQGEDVYLQVNKQDDEVKLAWISRRFKMAYCIEASRLKTACDAVRNVLGVIARQYAHGQRQYTQFLPALANAGKDLDTVLFTSGDNEEEHEARDFLLGLPIGTRLNIVSDSKVEVPWNFINAGQSKPPKARNELCDFDDFWHQRFRVRIRYHNARPRPRRPIERKGVKTLLALHESRFLLATSFLFNQAPDLKSKVEQLLGTELGATMDWEDCKTKWDSICDQDSILYIFAHRDEDQNLCLAEDDKVDLQTDYKYRLNTAAFSSRFRKSKARTLDSNTLCFVNGCRTAEGEWGETLLSATSAPGFHGFIGSEAEVPSDIATRYAVEFLYALLEEHATVDEAYDSTKAKCFPLSLWYSCYALPEFQIAKP